MATIVLGAVGSYFGGPIGGFVGASLGAYLDNAYIYPALFPKPTIKGPQLDDLSVQTASEGAPAKVVFGPLNRTAGEVIWKTDLIPVVDENRVGGQSGVGGQKYELTSYYVHLAISFGDARKVPVTGRGIVKMWANGKVIWENGAPTAGYASAIRVYDGSQTTPDPLIESYRGVGNTPAYKHDVYAVIEWLAVAEFGNAPPQVTAWIEQDPDLSLAGAVGLIMNWAEYEAAEYDVSRLSRCFKGMVVTGPQAPGEVIGPLQVVYNFAVRERDDGVIEFVQRGEEDRVAVDLADLPAFEAGSPESVPWTIRFGDVDDYKVPSNVQFRYVRSENDMQAGSEAQRRVDLPTDTTLSIDAPVTMSSEEARAAARRILWEAEVQRQPVELNLPPSYIGRVREGDVLLVPHLGRTWEIFASSVSIGDNYVVAVQGFVSLAETYDVDGVASGSTTATNSNYVPPDLSAAVLDVPALTDDQVEAFGVYVAACVEDPADAWRGAAEYASADGTTYALGTRLSVEAGVGTLSEPLAEGPTWEWDDANYVHVDLDGRVVLEDCTDDECLAGQNRIALRTPDGDWEIIGFASVEQTASNSFKLSRLLRGLRGTEHLVGSHAPGEKCCVLRNDGSIAFAVLPGSNLGATVSYKFPALGAAVASVAAQSEAFRGRTKRPMSPVHMELENDPVRYVLSATTGGSTPTFTTQGTHRLAPGMGLTLALTGDSPDVDGDYVVATVPAPDKFTLAGCPPLSSSGEGTASLAGLLASWVRRGRRATWPFSTDSVALAADESPETYEVDFATGYTPENVVRTIACGSPSVLYSSAEQTADGWTGTEPVRATVYQISRDVGRGVGASKEIDR